MIEIVKEGLLGLLDLALLSQSSYLDAVNFLLKALNNFVVLAALVNGLGSIVHLNYFLFAGWQDSQLLFLVALRSQFFILLGGVVNLGLELDVRSQTLSPLLVLRLVTALLF